MNFLGSILDGILSLVFPTYCVSCRDRGAFLCKRCLSECGACERETQKWIFPVFDYRDPNIKKAVRSAKYNGKKGVMKIFAGPVYGRIIEELADLKIMENFTRPVVIPVPLSGKRQRARGFNQAAILAKAIVDLDENKNLELGENFLFKRKEVEHQARIKGRRDRLANIAGSFGVKNAELIKNRCLILIDDVTTTGATLNEAKKVLREAGAKKIIAFAVAH